MNSNDDKLSGLLRESRLSPMLPPRFQENLWRRIEDAEAPVKSEPWLDPLAALILRPRFEFATAAVLLFAGITLGALDGSQVARHDAQTRYLEPAHHPGQQGTGNMTRRQFDPASFQPVPKRLPSAVEPRLDGGTVLSTARHRHVGQRLPL